MSTLPTSLNKWQRREIETMQKMQHFGANYLARGLSMLWRSAPKKTQQAEILALAQRLDLGVAGGPFNAVIPAVVVVVPVPVVFAIGQVVLPVVLHQIRQGEAVVGGEEIDAASEGGRLTAKQIRAA